MIWNVGTWGSLCKFINNDYELVILFLTKYLGIFDKKKKKLKKY